MTGNRDSSASENPGTVRRMRVPFLGLTSVVAGVIMPTWVTLASIAAGPETWGWVPLAMVAGFPYNFVALALLVVTVVCGIYALRKRGADRVLGIIGLILAGAQLLAAAPIVWFLTFGMIGL